jgi:hypothetical protein
MDCLTPAIMKMEVNCAALIPIRVSHKSDIDFNEKSNLVSHDRISEWLAIEFILAFRWQPY